MKKSLQKEDKGKYIKKNCIKSNKKNKYKNTSLLVLKNLPNIYHNNFNNIFQEFNQEFNSKNISAEKVEILDDGSICIKNTKNTTRIDSPQNDNTINKSNLLINDNIYNDDYIYNTEIKYNKSVPNIRIFTYAKEKENFMINNEVYIKHKPYNNSGKTKINIKSKKKDNNESLNYKRALFNENNNFEYDIINHWKYLSNKYIIHYNKIMLGANIKIIIQNLKLQKKLKYKEKLPTNLINIINPQQINLDEINERFFNEAEKICKKEDKMIKYKGGIESINEEMNESNEEQDEINNIKNNKIKEKLKRNKKISDLEIKDTESLSFSPNSIKSKDIKFIFNKNNYENNNENKINNKDNKDIYLIYKKEIIDNKGIKLIFNEKNKNSKRYNLNINSYKKILKMALYKKREEKLTKEKYESLILTIINNCNCYKNSIKNKFNFNDKKIIINDNNLKRKIIDLEESIKDLKSIYIYGLYNIQLISDKQNKINFIKKLNLTKKRNKVKKIYKEILFIINNDINKNNIDIYQKVIDILKNYEKLNDEDIKNNNKININKILRFLITMYIIFLPIIFIINYLYSNSKKI